MNNFDMSSTGTNIELTINHDCGMASVMFGESITKVGDLNVFTSCETIDASEYEKEYNVTDAALELFKKYFKHVFNCDFSVSIDDDVEILLDELGMDVTEETDVNDLLESIRSHCGDAESYCKFLEEHFEAKFFTLTTRGYSQGDEREVIIPFELLEAFGLPTTQESADTCQVEIDHLFWDAPIYANLVVDGEEYSLHNNLKDLYNYSKEEVVKIAKEMVEDETKHEIVVEFLKENLPDTLDYVH